MRVWAIALLCGQVAVPLTPADSLAAAHADLARLPAELRPHVRYLSGYQLTQGQWAKLLPVLNGHCNSLSREPDLTPLAIAGPRLARVIVKDYGWSRATWDKIADPYFSVVIEKEITTPWGGGIWPRDGRFYPARSFNVIDKVKAPALAPWLSETPEARAKLADVVSWTQSKAPVVSALYFLDLTSAAEDRSPNYYDFLGIKDEKTWDEAVGLDVRAAEKFPAVLRDAVSISEITKYDRGIVALGKIRGTAFKTRDHGKGKAGSALRVLGKDADKDYDATETIAALPNGLLAFGLFNAKGERQDKAPDNIVKVRVDAYRSCLECHDRGFRDVDSWAKGLLTPPLNLLSPDYETARKLRREYAAGLKRDIEDERAKYDARMKEACGLDAKGFARGLTDTLHAWEAPEIGRAHV